MIRSRTTMEATKLSRSFSSSSKTPPLQTLLKRGFTPTVKSINQFLLFLSQSHKFQSIIDFFSQLQSNQIRPNSQTHSILIWALLRLHKFQEAEHFLKNHLPKTSNSPKNRMWDSLIEGICVKQKDPEKAQLVLQDCLRNHGILPSSYSFCSLIHNFVSHGMMGRAIEVLELMTDEKVRYPFDNFVCSSVISGFCRIGQPELAVGFFENAESSGALQPNVVTYTALVSALCQLGRVKEVCDLVCRMEKEGLVLDVVFYSSWICGHFREGFLMEAFQKHRQMTDNRIKPDTISYTILIDGFCKEGNVEKAVGFLNKMTRNGLKPNLVTYTAIMMGFCKKGKLEDAFNVFKMVEDMGINADEFMYATLIDGVCRTRDFDRVFHLLDEMEKKGINPSILAYNTLINGLCKVGRTSEADEVSKGIVGDIVTYSTLLHGYVEEENVTGILETKRRLEEAGVCMDIVMCNILIKALFMVGAFEDAYALYKGMSEMDLVADSVTYSTMIDRYCKVGRINEALEIFDDFRGTSVCSVSCYNCIIHGLCRNGMVDMAIEVFVELNLRGLALDVGTSTLLIKAIFEKHSAEGIINFIHRIEDMRPDIYDITCNGAICFLCKRAFSEAASSVYMVMRKKGSVVTRKSYYSILKGLIDDGKKWLSQPFLNTFVKEYGLIEPLVSRILVRFLCLKDVNNALRFLNKLKEDNIAITFPVTVFKELIMGGRVLDAYELFLGAKGNLPAMDMVDYTIMVDGLCKGGYLSKALDLCAFVKKEGITLNIIAFNSVINGLCRQGCLVEAFRLFDSLERINMVPSEITYATLIDNLSKGGFLPDAKKLFKKMVLKGFKPNTRVYNSLIYGYCKFGQMEEALKLLYDLEINSLSPDAFTVSAVIYGCCQKGDMEGALGFFLEFKRKGKLPDFLGFMFLIKGLCAKGRMEEARSILREMLQSQSVVELINRVDIEDETESIESFLAFLCDQGSIQEAIIVLNEVGSIFFPVWRWCSAFESQQPNRLCEREAFGTVASRSVPFPYRTDMAFGSCDVKKVKKMMENHVFLGKRSLFHDFDSYYSLIASLCSRGELQKANRLAKEMLPDEHSGC